MSEYKNFTIYIGKQSYETVLLGGDVINIKSDVEIPTELPDLANYISVYVEDLYEDFISIVVENHSDANVNIAYTGWIEDSDAYTSEYNDTTSVSPQSSTDIDLNTDSGSNISNYYFHFSFSATGYKSYEEEIEN